SQMRHGGEPGASYTQLREQIRERLTQPGVTDEVIATQLTGIDTRWKELVGIYPETTLRRALTILSLLEEKKIEQVDILGRSQGGIDVAVAARLCPDKFRNFVLLNTAGMMGESTVRE